MNETRKKRAEEQTVLGDASEDPEDVLECLPALCLHKEDEDGEHV